MQNTADIDAVHNDAELHTDLTSTSCSQLSSMKLHVQLSSMKLNAIPLTPDLTPHCSLQSSSLPKKLNHAMLCRCLQQQSRANVQYNSCDLARQCEAAGLAPSYDSRQMSPLHKAAHSLALMDSYMGEHYLASSHWLYDIMCVPCS